MNFVAEQNIKRFRQLLECETDPSKRKVLEDLLADEEAKLAEIVPASRGAPRSEQ